MKSLIINMIFILIIFTTLVQGSLTESYASDIGKSTVAGNFHLRDINNRELKLENLNSNLPILLVFFDLKKNKYVLPKVKVINQLYNKHNRVNFLIIAINVNEEASPVELYQSAVKSDLDGVKNVYVLQGNSYIKDLYNVKNKKLPVVYFISRKNGNKRYILKTIDNGIFLEDLKAHLIKLKYVNSN